MATAGKNTLSNFYQQNHTLVAFCPNSILLKALQFELMNNFDNCFIGYPGDDIVSEIKSHLNKKATGKSNEYFIDLEPQSLDCEKITNFEKFCQSLLAIDNFVQESHLKMIVVLPFFDPYLAATLTDSWIKHYSPKQAEHFSMLAISGTNPAEITIANGEHADETMTFEFYHDLSYSGFFKSIITNKLQNEILANQHNREVFDHLVFEIRNNRPNSEIIQKEIEQKLESLNASFVDLRDYIVEDNFLFKTLKDEETKILQKDLSFLKLKNDSDELQVLIEKAKILVGDKAVSCEELFVDCQNGFERYIIARAAVQKWKFDNKKKKRDFSLFEIKDMFDEDIIPCPNYHRVYVDEVEASKLVESALLGVSIPTIHLCEKIDGTYSVVDGEQTMTFLVKYLRNEFKLKKLSKLPNLNGLYFKDLDKVTQENLKSFLLNTIISIK